MSKLRSAIDDLATVDVAGLLAAAMGAQLRELMRQRDRLDGQIQRVLTAFDQQGCCETDGARSTSAWLRGRCRISGGEASTRVKTARALRDLPKVRAAFEDGEMSLAHARSIAMLAADTSVAATQNIEEQLVQIATLVDPVRFSNELRLIRDAVKRDGSDGSDNENPADPDDAFRRLSLAASFEGRWSINGWLTREGGATLKAALDALARPLPGDDRSAGQRYADALVELARRTMNHDNLPTKHGVRPHLVVTAKSESTASCPDSPRDAGRIRLFDGQVVGGGVLSEKTLARLACDSTMRRVLFGPDGHVLDLGRSSRIVSAAQWQALVIRDGGCVIPGHDCPIAHTEAHHLWSWLHGGPTDLWNLAPVCTRGHTLLHEYEFVLYLNDDNYWVLRKPDGTEIIGLPLGQTHHGNLSSALNAMANGPRGPCPG